MKLKIERDAIHSRSFAQKAVLHLKKPLKNKYLSKGVRFY